MHSLTRVFSLSLMSTLCDPMWTAYMGLPCPCRIVMKFSRQAYWGIEVVILSSPEIFAVPGIKPTSHMQMDSSLQAHPKETNDFNIQNI